MSHGSHQSFAEQRCSTASSASEGADDAFSCHSIPSFPSSLRTRPALVAVTAHGRGPGRTGGLPMVTPGGRGGRQALGPAAAGGGRGPRGLEARRAARRRETGIAARRDRANPHRACATLNPASASPDAARGEPRALPRRARLSTQTTRKLLGNGPPARGPGPRRATAGLRAGRAGSPGTRTRIGPGPGWHPGVVTRLRRPTRTAIAAAAGCSAAVGFSAAGFSAAGFWFGGGHLAAGGGGGPRGDSDELPAGGGGGG